MISKTVLDGFQATTSPKETRQGSPTPSSATAELSGQSFEKRSGAKNNYRPLKPKDVEHHASEVFGPELLAEDFVWDCFGYMAGFHYVIGSLRGRIQAIARRYRHDPARFQHAIHQLVMRHDRKYANDPQWRRSCAIFAGYAGRVEWAFKTTPNTEDHMPNFREALSSRKLVALADLLPVARSAFKGRPLNNVKPKKLLADLGTLAANRPGPAPEAVSKLITKRFRELSADGKHPTLGEIARRVFRGYTKSTGDAKRALRERVRLALRRYKKIS